MMRAIRPNQRRHLIAATTSVTFVAVIVLQAAAAWAQGGALVDEGRLVFRQTCASCHNIGGGDKVGPDLQNVRERRTEDWISRFVVDPAGMKRTDDDARNIDAQYATDMAPQVLTPAQITALIAFFEYESGLERSEFHAPERIDRAITPADIAAGRRIFLGLDALSNGGPACLSCHTVGEEGGLGGGKLAISLAGAYNRLSTTNPDGLLLSIQNPGFPVMQDMFGARPITPDEAFGLNAYLMDVAARPNADRPWSEAFPILGILGAIFALAVFDLVWRKRFTAVRKPLVGGRP